MAYDPNQLPPTRQFAPTPPQSYQPPYPAAPVSGQPYPQHPYSAPPAYYPPAPRKRQWPTIIGIIAAVVVAACLFGGALSNFFPAEKDPASEQERAAAAPRSTAVERTQAAVTPPPAAKQSLAPLSPPEAVAKVKMPDVKGQNAAVAGDYLKNLGFTNVRYGSQDEYDNWVVLPENWTVKKQSAKAGRTLPANTLIVLTCTKVG